MEGRIEFPGFCVLTKPDEEFLSVNPVFSELAEFAD